MIRIAVLPVPIPQNVRPGASWLIVAIAAAVTGASRVPATATPVPSRIVDVRVAATANIAYTSLQIIWLSANQAWVNPSRSASTTYSMSSGREAMQMPKSIAEAWQTAPSRPGVEAPGPIGR